MQCPICHDNMELYQEEPAYSKNKDIVYKRTKYVCRTDDVWGRLEIPQGKQEGAEAHKKVPAPHTA